MVRVLALHAVSSGLTSGIPHRPMNLPKVIPDCILGVTPEYCQMWPKEKTKTNQIKKDILNFYFKMYAFYVIFIYIR